MYIYVERTKYIPCFRYIVNSTLRPKGNWPLLFLPLEFRLDVTLECWVNGVWNWPVVTTINLMRWLSYYITGHGLQPNYSFNYNAPLYKCRLGTKALLSATAGLSHLINRRHSKPARVPSGWNSKSMKSSCGQFLPGQSLERLELKPVIPTGLGVWRIKNKEGQSTPSILASQFSTRVPNELQ